MGDMEIERIASLEAKMDYLVRAVDNLTATLASNYVPRREIETRMSALERRLEKAENAPAKWLGIGIAIAGAVPGVIALFKG